MALADDAQDYIQNVDYPASKADLIDAAQDEGADDMMLDSLRDGLDDTIYDSPEDVRVQLDSLSR